MKKILGILLSLAVVLTAQAPSTINASGLEANIGNGIYFVSEDITEGDIVRVFGDALSEAEQDEITEIFNQNVIKADANGSTAEESTLSYQELDTYLGNPEGTSAGLNMISSVQIEKLPVGTGTYVEIITPDDITRVTHYDYNSAVITAGLEDVYVQVASLRAATGESALSGIYKSAELLGFTLDPDRVEAGNEEIDLVTSIAEENEDNADFSIENFTGAINNMKQEVTDGIAQQGVNNINVGDIQIIVEEVLINFNINLTEEQITQVVNYLENYKNSLSDADLAKVQEQLSQFGEYLGSGLGNVRDYLASDDFQEDFAGFADYAGDLLQEAQESGLFDRIGQFFVNLWNWITGMFND